MKIKRYFAPTMREAIRLVRQEQGADAVILSNRTVAGGVEIIAAVDYDDNLLASPAGEAGAAATAAPVAPAVAGLAGQSQAASATASRPTSRPTNAGSPAERPSAAPAGKEQPAAPASRGGAARGTLAERYGEGALASDLPADEGVGGQPPATLRSEVRATTPEWAQEPTLVEMRKEIKNLRGILENQLSGLAWRDLKTSEPSQAILMQRMIELGLSQSLSREIATIASGVDDPDHAWRLGLSDLAGRIEVTGDDIIDNGGVVALVGPTGVGKTTTVAKLAARFALRHGRRHVALVTTDSYRIGAHEQLRTYGRLLGIPVHIAATKDELRATLSELSDRKLVLIDTAGMSQRDLRLSSQISTLEGFKSVRSYLVLSATTQGVALDQAVRAFRKITLAGCILTKLDEAATIGGALSVAIRHQLPVAYIGDGQRVPEDMHPARAHNLVNRGVAMLQEMADMEGYDGAFGATSGTGAPAHA